MYLKRLSLQGFKSFADRTPIAFSPGITAIVGPNGCGKSNLVEAVLWVCGEQSARSLRGERMEDVIFHGGGLRRPLGMAEVTLTLEGVRGRLPAPLGEQDTLEITRRLFRSGDSEYLLNQIPCRLKDIREALLDLGIGLRGHAIVEQGRVEQVLQMTPEERRLLVEEVAGILKFRMQRTEALRKLEATRHNLERIRDLIQEVRENRDRLERQVRRVRRYQEILGQIRRLELSLLCLRDRRHRKQQADLEAERQTLERELTDLETQSRGCEARLQQLRTQEESARDRLRRLQSEVQALEDTLRGWEHQREVLLHQGTGLRQQWERLEEEARREEGSLKRLQEEMDRREGMLRETQAQENQLELALGKEEEAATALSRERERLLQQVEAARQRVFALAASRSEVRNHLQRLQHLYEGLQRRQHRLQGQLERIRQARSEVEARLQQVRASLEDLNRVRQDHETRKALVEQERAQVRGEIAVLRRCWQEQQQQHQRWEARYQSLLELEREGLGLEESARRVLVARAEEPVKWAGIHGLVVHFVETDPRFEVAVEVALDRALQGIVVEDLPQVLEVLQVLRQEGGGQAIFLPRKRVRPLGGLRPPLPPVSGVVGWALDRVRIVTPYEQVLIPLLEGVVLVEDLKTALECWEQGQALFPAVIRWVTLEGEVVEWYGGITGGTRAHQEGSLLARRREIRELEDQLDRLREEMGRTEAAREALEQREHTLNQEIQAREQAIQESRLEQVRQERELAHLEREHTRLQEQEKGLVQEWEELKASHQTALREQREQMQVLQDLEGQEQEAREALDQAQQALQGLERQWQAFQDRMLALRTQRVQLEERKASLRRELEEQRRHREALLRRRQARTGEIQRLREEESRKQAERKRLEEACRQEGSRLRDRKASLQQQEEAVLHLEVQRRELEQTDRRLRKHIEELRTRLGEWQLQETTLRLERSRIQDHLDLHYRLSLDDLEEETRDWEEKSLSEADLEARLQALRGRLDRVGPVDPSVLEAFQEVSERLDFLERQEADLLEASHTLQQTIHRINRTTRERFLEAYEVLNARFQELFQTLFEGGEARLVLTRPDAPLETGVEIRAQPTGKRVRHLSQLSGGEKALTAIALILARFLIRPAPFCILDESDAPLDEANTDRFLNLLAHLRGHVQFLLITHNKRTMEAADRLYGVTMEEPGVSKVLSVDLSRATTLQVG